MKKIASLILFAFTSGMVSAQKTQIRYLSGTDKDHTVQWDFYCTDGQNSGKWTKIAVPSNWEQQGFGSYNYGLDKVKANEQGQYKYQFNTEPGCKGKKVYLVFDGSMTDTEVKINGRSAGAMHQGSFYRFKYDITNLLKPSGGNLLEVTVSKTSANKSVNHAERNGDFWIFGGIFRPVYLEVVPPTHIERLAIDAKADGSFNMDVYPQHIGRNETIEAQVRRLNGENIGRPFAVKTDASPQKTDASPQKTDVSPEKADASPGKVTLKSNFSHPLLWSSEFPHLYQVVVSIKKGKEIIHQVTQQFGFRTVELRKNDGFYVNGVKIMFRGVDRHSFWPETGRTLSHAVQVLDVNLMKEMNMNAVRMSHYPPDEDFIHVCDSLGLYVLDEVTGWHGAYDTVVGHKIVKEMVTRDVNHPSVVIWDNGNEGGWNVALDDDYALYDPQKRIVIHPWARLNGTNTKHYPDYAYMLNSVATEQDVFFPTEFMHGLYDGGAGAALDDFWNLMLQHPHSAGGFIWAFLDEAVVRTDKNGSYDTDGNHAPDGIVGPHREKEASFYTIKNIWSPVHVSNQAIDSSFDGKLEVENRYFFTNLNQCRFAWKLLSLPSATDKSIRPVALSGGIAAKLNMEPGAKGTLQLHLPPSWARADALYLTAYGPDQKEVCTWSWAIKTPSTPAATRPGSTATGRGRTTTNPGRTATDPGRIMATEDSSEVTVNCGGIQYVFDKKTGYIARVVKPAIEMGTPGAEMVTPATEISLSGGPVLAGVHCKLKQFTHTASNGQYIVEADYQGATGSLHVKWTFDPATPAKLEYQYSQQGDADFIGIIFNYPDNKITGMKWEGRGPYRVWKNRLKGQQFGVWHKDYNDAITGETWGYPEFKGYHSEVNWVVIENKESPFTVYTDDKNMYLQIGRPSREKAALKNNNVEPAFPDGNIGFLSAIAPIGTKFQAAKVMGPQSQQNTPSAGPVSGTLWFDFSSGTNGRAIDKTKRLSQAGDDPEKRFLSPPASAKPGVLWMWMGSNISEAGIKKDLEALKKEGFNRTTMFSLSDITTPWASGIGNSPTPELVSWTEPWWKMVRYAAIQSKRLGMDFGMYNGPGYESSGGPWITPELSMQEICWSMSKVAGNTHVNVKLERPTVDLHGHTPWPIHNPETGKLEKPEVAARGTYYKEIAVLALPAKGIVPASQVIDLTDRMKPDGSLDWDAPAGDWIIYRFGHTTSGTLIQPAPWKATGLECDKMSQQAMDFHLDHVIGEIKKHLGDLIGTGFTHVHFDSYEAGIPTWTPRMREEFLQRRGYDLTPYLATFAGRIIGNDKTDSAKFVEDFSATVKDLYRDIYFTTISKKLSAAKLRFLCEPYGGPWRQDEIMPLVKNVMTEFWTSGGNYSPIELDETVASLRKSGQNIVEAEAFTGAPADSKWDETPAWLKSMGDAAFCAGVNRLVLHRFVEQALDDKYKPGATMGQWGTHFDRTQTWWEPAKAMVKYWQRCQALLQWGSIVTPDPDDCSITDSKGSKAIKHIHRSDGHTHIYFVANTSRQPLSAVCYFKVTGMQPELWDPVTGNMRDLPQFDHTIDHTVLSLDFDDAQSFFVVFRKKIPVGDKIKGDNFAKGSNSPVRRDIMTITGSWLVKFDPKWGGPAHPVIFAGLDDWTKRPETGIKYYSGTAVYTKSFDIPGKVLSDRPVKMLSGKPQTALPDNAPALYLDLGVVKHIARVTINNTAVGIVWTAPWRIQIPAGLLKTTNNLLTIEVTNVWANRLIGDEQEPADCEWLPAQFGGYYLKEFPEWFVKNRPRPSQGRYCFTTWNYFKKDSPLISSGLLGPVRIIAQE